MDFEEILINLDFIYLRVKINNAKIIKVNIEKKVEENYSQEYEIFVDEIKSYFFGKKEFFNLDLINFDSLTDFQKDVLIHLSKVPRGMVTTYKNLSLKLNKKNSFRAVGNALRLNPFPIIIPCHRVIKSDFTLGDYGYGSDLKKMLLIFEGVTFLDDNRVKSECVL